MVTIYYRKNCNSSKKALQWLKKHNIKYQGYSTNNIPKDTLLHILSLTDEGFTNILKIQGDKQTQLKIKKLYQMSTYSALTYLKKHPEILRSPIIFSENKILIGYNDDEIRKFIPQPHRYKNERIT